MWSTCDSRALGLLIKAISLEETSHMKEDLNTCLALWGWIC